MLHRVLPWLWRLADEDEGRPDLPEELQQQLLEALHCCPVAEDPQVTMCPAGSFVLWQQLMLHCVCCVQTSQQVGASAVAIQCVTAYHISQPLMIMLALAALMRKMNVAARCQAAVFSAFSVA